MRSLTRTTWRWLLPTLGLAGLGLLASPGFAATVTFDAGEGLPAAFSEAGITVEPLVGAESHVHLGDNDGDGSSDLMLHALCCSTPYVFTFADGTFTPAKLDFVLDGGVHTLTSSSGASLALDATGTVHLPAVGWSGITQLQLAERRLQPRRPRHHGQPALLSRRL